MSRRKQARQVASAEAEVSATGAGGSTQEAAAASGPLKEKLMSVEQDNKNPRHEDEQEQEQEEEFKAPLAWTNIILFVILHSALPIGAYMIYSQRPWRTLMWSLFGVYISVLGVTAGTHRLWSHRSYKARWPVQVLLMALQTMAGQNSIYTWSRDHRVHHKFSETNADPHNIKRGFFFAHMGWLCCKKHPDVKSRGSLVDMSDLEANPVVMFQHRHFWWLAILFTVLLPTLVPVLLWREHFWTSFVISFMWRYIISLHGTWLVNSAAHYHGDRPYDERIEARESPVVIWTAMGEGFHNYHHTFPQDYSTSEFGAYFNITTAFIDLCALLGLAYDRRKMAAKVVKSRQLRTGDKRPPPSEAAAASLATLSSISEAEEDEQDAGASGRQVEAAATAGEEEGQEQEEREEREEDHEDGIELISRPALVAQEDQIKMKYSL